MINNLTHKTSPPNRSRADGSLPGLQEDYRIPAVYRPGSAWGRLEFAGKALRVRLKLGGEKMRTSISQRRLVAKIVCFAAIAVLLVELIPGLYNAWWNRPANYQLNSAAAAIVGEPVKVFADKLEYNSQTQAY